MSEDTQVILQQPDPVLLTDLVRQDQHNDTFELIDWKVDPIRHAKLIDTTGGLYRFSGHGRDGEILKPWSIVLKILNKPAEDGDPRSTFYWKRELLTFESGLLANLPGALRAPRSYAVIERDDGGWLWMEYIEEATERRWSLEHFYRAAYEFGRFGGNYLTGRPLPNQPWLSRPLFQSLVAEGSWWISYMNPSSPINAWQSPLVQRAFDEPLRSRVLNLWTEVDRFATAMDRLPQVFCHNDLNRRNLMLRRADDDGDELVVLDWAWCGNGAAGLDMGWMVADALFFFDFDHTRAEELEAAVLEGYMAGLRAVGWNGDERTVRLGYLIPTATWGGLLPGWTAMMLSEGTTASVTEMYGRTAEAVLEGWVTSTEFLLERADQATYLMQALGVG